MIPAGSGAVRLQVIEAIACISAPIERLTGLAADAGLAWFHGPGINYMPCFDNP